MVAKVTLIWKRKWHFHLHSSRKMDIAVEESPFEKGWYTSDTKSCRIDFKPLRGPGPTNYGKQEGSRKSITAASNSGQGRNTVKMKLDCQKEKDKCNRVIEMLKDDLEKEKEKRAQLERKLALLEESIRGIKDGGSGLLQIPLSVSGLDAQSGQATSARGLEGSRCSLVQIKKSNIVAHATIFLSGA